MMQKEHLPIYGVGPLCGGSMVVFFIIGVLLQSVGYLDSGKIWELRIYFLIFGVILMALGGWFWIQAVLVAKIDRAILDNQLVTIGVYSWVRNPIYSEIAIVLTDGWQNVTDRSILITVKE